MYTVYHMRTVSLVDLQITICAELLILMTVLGIKRETKAMRVCLVYMTHLQTVCFKCVNF